MQQLSALDSSFLYFETPNAPMHIGGVAIYDPSTAPEGFSFERILEVFGERLHMARTFRQRVVEVPFNLDHPFWIEDPDFDLEFHVRHIGLPKPGGWRQLCDLAARLHSRPLDTTRPLWEFTVIEGLNDIPGTPEGSYAVVSKIHHAAIDGVSGAEITAAIHDLEPDAQPPPAKTEWRPERIPQPMELMARAYGSNLMKPFQWAEVLTKSVPAMARATTLMRTRSIRPAVRPGRVPRTRFSGTVTPHRVVDGRSFPLDDLRAIKSAVRGATINDVVLTICGGALRSYLLEADELPRHSLVAMAPISVRPEEGRGKLGNLVSAMAVGIGTEIDDPKERLREVHGNAIESKALTNAVGARLMTDYSQFIPSATAGLAARLYSRLGIANQINPIFNCVITNVPGPQVPLYSAGARLVTQYGLGPILDGMGLIFPVFSYCGQLTISFTSCREMLPDPERLADALQESFEELKRATISPKAEPKPKRAPKAKTSEGGRSKAVAKKKKKKKKKAAKRRTTRGKKKAKRKSGKQES